MLKTSSPEAEPGTNMTRWAETVIVATLIVESTDGIPASGNYDATAAAADDDDEDDDDVCPGLVEILPAPA